MEITGIIIKLLPEKTGVSKTTGEIWKVQQYVIETKGNRPRQIIFEVLGENRIHDMNIQMGEELTIFFDIEAHEFHGKWYNLVSAWKVVRAGTRTQSVLTPISVPLTSIVSNTGPIIKDLPFDDNTDLPF